MGTFARVTVVGLVVGVGACAIELLILAAGCGQVRSVEPTDARGDQPGQPDAPLQPDQGNDMGPGDAPPSECEPGCHWDCLGVGWVCEGGNVYQLEIGAAPCCRATDPWPYPGPPCAGQLVHVCGGGTCLSHKDNVYSQCMYIAALYLDPSELSHLSLLPCPEAYKQVGDPCASVDDCRPVKPGAAERLVCDPTSNTCVPAARPAAPPDYGQSCGLANAAYSGYEDVALPGNLCELCHARWDSTAGCLRQGCTMECKYDEDCPVGSVCVCLPEKSTGKVVQICAATDERDTAPGRTKNLKCYPFPDAGTDGPSDGGPPDTGDLGQWVDCGGLTGFDNSCVKWIGGTVVDECCRGASWMCPPGYQCMHWDCPDHTPKPCPTTHVCRSPGACWCNASQGTCDGCELCVPSCGNLLPSC